MHLSQVMSMERNALLNEYLVPAGVSGVQIPPYVAVPEVEVLVRTPSAIRGRYPVVIEHLKTSRDQSFIQVCPSLGYRFLWTHVDNEGYRDDYVTFVRERHGVAIDRLPKDLHVDHLFNRARARALRLPWVRLALLPSFVNTSHGAGYERARTQGRIGTPGNQRGIDEIVLMKLFGISSPGKGRPLTPDMQAHLQRMSSVFMIPSAELERNVRELMDVAAFRPSG